MEDIIKTEDTAPKAEKKKKLNPTELILEALRNLPTDKPITVRDLNGVTGISYPTLHKHVDLLEARGQIDIKKIGSAKTVYLKEAVVSNA